MTHAHIVAVWVITKKRSSMDIRILVYYFLVCVNLPKKKRDACRSCVKSAASMRFMIKHSKPLIIQYMAYNVPIYAHVNFLAHLMAGL